MSIFAFTLSSSPAIWLAEPRPPEAKRELARARSRQRDQLGQRPHRQRRMDRQHVGHARAEHDRREVRHEVVGQLAHQRDVDRVRRPGEEQGIAVRRRLGRQRRADVGRAARPVVEDDLLAPDRSDVLGHHARDEIGVGAGGVGHDHPHRAGWPGLRPRPAGHAQRRDCQIPCTPPVGCFTKHPVDPDHGLPPAPDDRPATTLPDSVACALYFTTPQATRAPEFPAGSDFSSSACA